jgi:hypothetical protein
MLAAASKYDERGWPSTPKNVLCVAFLEMAYPMVMRNDAKNLIIGLNSTNIVPSTITGSAL